jgi:hypothetical protein
MSERSAQKKAPVSGAICLGVVAWGLDAKPFHLRHHVGRKPISPKIVPASPRHYWLNGSADKKTAVIGNRRPVKIL